MKFTIVKKRNNEMVLMLLWFKIHDKHLKQKYFQLLKYEKLSWISEYI